MKNPVSATALATVFISLSAGAQARDLTVVTQNVAPFLDPARDHSNVGQQFYHNSFDTLIAKDPTTTDLKWQPGLATEWKQIDPVTLELKLRQSVKFHDGSDMSADDVIFSLNRMFQATFPPYEVRAKDRLNNFDRAEKVDETTIRVYAKQAEPLWETLMNLQQLSIVPQNYIAGLSGDPVVVENSDYEAFSMKPVGTGPYKIIEFTPEQKLVYERFEDFWGDKAPLEKVTVIRVPEVSARLTALRTGEADIATNIAPDQLSIVDSDPDMKAEGSATALFHMMIMNQKHPQLKDPKIRQALTLAIDRNLLNEALWQGKAIVPDSHTMAEFGSMYMPELKTYEYNPEKAKKLLKEAGYDGFEIIYDTNGNYYTNGLLAAQAITEMWKAVGFNASVRDIPDWTGGKPDMMTRNWSNPMYFTDPFGSFGVMWAPDGPSVGEGRFNTDENYAKLWEKFRYSADQEDRKQAFAGLMEYQKTDPAFIPLYRPYESWAMRNEVNWKPQPGLIAYVLDFRPGSISFND